MPNSQARRTTPASGAVAVTGSSTYGDSPVYGGPGAYLADPDRSGYVAGPDRPGYLAGPDRSGYVAGPDRSGYIAGPDRSGYVAGPDRSGYVAAARTVSAGGRSSTVYGRGDQSGGAGPPRRRAGSAQYRPGERPPGRGRKDPMWARLLVLFGAFLMLASGGAIVGGKALVAQATGSVERAPLLGGAGAAQGEKALDGALNILMVGIDERPSSTEPVRADSIMILHIPASHDEAFLVSIPRDAYVEIPPYAKTKFGGTHEKINAAFAFGWQNGGGREGGFELLALTVQRITGLRFNAGAIVDFKGFESVVEALGGVDLCVDTKKPVVSEHYGFDGKGKFLSPKEGGRPMIYNPGECRKFKSWEALDYVRQRYSLEDGDYGRQRHQQQFLKALAKEAKKQNLAGNPRKLLQIIQAAGKTLTLDLRGARIESWLFTVRNVADSDIVMLKSNGGKFNAVQCGAESCEGLTPETLSMFESLANDTLSEFVVQHPEFINAG
jgi:LCP family protein required for cell wall assembly